MEAVINRLGPDDTDIVRKMAVGAEYPAAVTAFARCVEMHNLSGRMYARIGTAGTDHFDALVGDDFQRVFDAFLHPDTRALALPAVVRRTVVLKAQSDAQFWKPRPSSVASPAVVEPADAGLRHPRPELPRE